MASWNGFVDDIADRLARLSTGLKNTVSRGEGYSQANLTDAILISSPAENRAMDGFRGTTTAIGQGSKAVTLGDIGNVVTGRGGDLSAVERTFKILGRHDAFEEVNGKVKLKTGWQSMEHKYGFWDNMKIAHMDLAKGEYSKKKVLTSAGTAYVGAMAAGRVLSGGGIYRDKDGNTDIIGLPII